MNDFIVDEILIINREQASFLKACEKHNIEIVLIQNVSCCPNSKLITYKSPSPYHLIHMGMEFKALLQKNGLNSIMITS